MEKPSFIAVLTTQNSLYGYRLLNGLYRNGQKPDMILVRPDSLKRKLKLLRSVSRRIGMLDAFLAALKTLEISKKVCPDGLWRNSLLIKDYEAFSSDVRYVDDFHSEACLEGLRKSNPDFLFLAQTGIVKDSLIQVAARGVLNAHPGFLPYYRGVDIPWWTLAEGKIEFLGSSLHFVDRGIDTGAIVKVKKFQDQAKPSFDLLEERLYEDCIDLMVEAFVQIRAGQELNKTPQEKLQGRQFYKMDRASRRNAFQMYQKWNLSSGV